MPEAATILQDDKYLPALEELVTLKEMIHVKHHSFIDSLMGYYEEHGRLTDKQFEWVLKLIRKAVSGEDVEEVSEECGPYLGLVNALNEYNKEMPYGYITMGGIKVSVAGKKSKYCGSVMVTNTAPYGSPQAAYYGRVDLAGNAINNKQLESSQKTLDTTLEALLWSLKNGELKAMFKESSGWKKS